MRWTLLALAMLGCGASSKETKPPGCMDCGPGRTRIDTEKSVHDTLCNRVQIHAQAGCSPFDQMDPALMTGDCGAVASFQLAGMDQCLLESGCDALQQCFVKTRAADAPPPYRGPVRACQLPKEHPDLVLPAGFSRDEIEKSYGHGDRTYADSPSTKDRPIEVCGFPAAGSWLARMTCADGSHPLPTRNDAERARVRNVGEGGRCGRIIDQYTIECPEKSYDVFIDAYRCQQ